MQKQELVRDDAAFIQNVAGWPAWPLLPVKRYDKETREMECGIVIGLTGHETTVFLANMFDTEKRTGDIVKDFVGNLDIPRRTYDTIEGMLQDGWIVD